MSTAIAFSVMATVVLGVFRRVSQIFGPRTTEEGAFFNPLQHLCVAITLLPLSVLVCTLWPTLVGSYVQSAGGSEGWLASFLPFHLSEKSVAEATGWSTGLLIRIVSSLRTISLLGVPTATDVFTYLLVLLTAYGVSLSCRRLVTLSRILKASRRRRLDAATSPQGSNPSMRR
jgi:hypothetical protein